MNTHVLLAAEGTGRAVSGLWEARRLIERLELRLSRFVGDSELSQLNASAGRWRDVSPDLMDLLQLSLDLHVETNGLFDPAILPDLKTVGYDRSMDELRTRRAALPASSSRAQQRTFGQLAVDHPGGRVRVPSGMEIDLGGIAKGWIVQKAADLLHSRATACAVSAGGDIVFRGLPNGAMHWPVNIEDPLDSARSIAALHVGPGAVATSSIVKRSWVQGESVRHHIIDPRTRASAATDWLSVTVIAPEIAVAEVYAKALLIGGRLEAPALAAQRPEISYFTVEPDGTVTGAGADWEEIHEHSFAVVE